MPQPDATANKTPKYDFAVLDNAEPPRSIVYEIETDRPVLILGIEASDQAAVEEIASVMNKHDVSSVMLLPTKPDREHAISELIDDAIDEWHTGDSTEELHTFLGWSFEEYGAWVKDRTLPKSLARLAAPFSSKNSPPTG